MKKRLPCLFVFVVFLACTSQSQAWVNSHLKFRLGWQFQSSHNSVLLGALMNPWHLGCEYGPHPSAQLPFARGSWDWTPPQSMWAQPAQSAFPYHAMPQAAQFQPRPGFYQPASYSPYSYSWQPHGVMPGYVPGAR